MLINVTEYLDVSAVKYPEKTCFADENRSLSFKDLQREAKAVATFLLNENITKKPIVVFMDKCVDCLVSFLGIAYSGCFYTPIDISMPLDRINKILEVLDPAVIISDKKNISLTHNFNFRSKTLLLDEIKLTAIQEDKIGEAISSTIDTDPLYVLFTSGSTGTPKGVVVSHRSVIDYTEWVTQTFTITEEDVFGNQAPFYFDNSILDIYCTLKNGSTLNIIPDKLFAFPIKLLEYLRDQNITTIFWVPSALCIVANLKALGKVELKELRKVLFCGEVMPNKQLNMWRKVLPHVLYANLYGPTEITDVCTYYIVDRDFEDSEPLPIGIPCRNTGIIVLNENNELVKAGEKGELCVRGSSLSLGYYANPEKTKEAFVQNPLNMKYQELIYRTGDIVKYNEYGELMYLSRKDFQIKHMGHRIELGEIETVINGIEGVAASCCLYDEERKKIVLFYISTLDFNEIISIAKKKLPHYMIPSKCVKLQEMPLNINGKIDRIQLRQLM